MTQPQDIAQAAKAHAGHERKIADIELLRGFAILFVLMEHLRINLFTWNTPAIDHLLAYFRFWSGVDLFFVISGFVIARSLLPKSPGLPTFIPSQTPRSYSGCGAPGGCCRRPGCGWP